MKLYYAFIFLIVTGLSSCSGGYYSHIPRGKTNGKHVNNHYEFKPIDTIEYKILPHNVIQDTIARVLPKTIELSYIENETLITDSTNDNRDTVSYDDFVKDTYTKGKKLFHSYVGPSLITSILLYDANNVILVALAFGFHLLAFAGIVFMFAAGVLWLTKKRTNNKLKTQSSARFYETFLQIMLVLSSIFTLVVTDLITNPENWAQLVGVEAATAIFSLAGIIAIGLLLFILFVRAYIKKHKISTDKPSKESTPIKHPGWQVAFDTFLILVSITATTIIFILFTDFITPISIFGDLFAYFAVTTYFTILVMFAAAIAAGIIKQANRKTK